MSSIPSATTRKFKPMLYDTKKFEFSRYFIEHEGVIGYLQIANIPVDVLKVEKSMLPHEIVYSDVGEYLISYSAIVSFVNMGEKREPTQLLPNQSKPLDTKKIDLIDYITTKQTDEPWNEYMVNDDPLRLLRVKTIMTGAYWYSEHVTHLGDPYIEVKHGPIVTTETAALSRK